MPIIGCQGFHGGKDDIDLIAGPRCDDSEIDSNVMRALKSRLARNGLPPFSIRTSGANGGRLRVILDGDGLMELHHGRAMVTIERAG